MNEEIKFDLDKDIIIQIEMDSYMKYNDTIASMNDHLGEIYGYSDVKDMEEAQLKYEKKLAYKAIKELSNIINELEKYLNQEIIEWQDASDLWTKAQVQEDRIILDKLQELKDSD